MSIFPFHSFYEHITCNGFKVLLHVLCQRYHSYPKFCGKVNISPNIKISAPFTVEGSSLMSWLKRSPIEREKHKILTCIF